MPVWTVTKKQCVYASDDTQPNLEFGTFDQSYEFTFENIDADGDGEITKTEWDSFIDKNPNLSDDQKQMLKDHFDFFAKNDGSISASDFKEQELHIALFLDVERTHQRDQREYVPTEQ